MIQSVFSINSYHSFQIDLSNNMHIPVDGYATSVPFLCLYGSNLKSYVPSGPVYLFYCSNWMHLAVFTYLVCKNNFYFIL